MSQIEIDMLYQYSLGCEKEPKDFFVFTKDATAWNHQRNREVALAERKAEPYKEYRIEDFLRGDYCEPSIVGTTKFYP